MLSPSVNIVLDIGLHEIEKRSSRFRCSYSAANTLCLALSSLIKTAPISDKVLKAVSSNNPTLSKMVLIGDAEQLLHYLKGLSLRSVRTLSMSIVMLLLVLSGH